MKSVETTGKNIEKAIENALFELRAKREDVDIKILEEGGLFKKAKVLVSISEDCLDKYEKKTAVVEEDDEILDVKAMLKDVETLTKKESKEIEKEEKKEEKAEAKEIKKSEKEAKKSRISGIEFIKGLLETLNINHTLYSEETEDAVTVKVEGGNSGDLIGYRGECLNAIQYVASVIQNEYSQTRKKFILDIENYKSRREETLKALAHRMESRVSKTNKSIKLEPMTANERRIIHTALQQSETVETTSKGTEPNRYVVILPKKSNEENID